MKETEEMYWVLCPRCSSKIVKIRRGEIEAVCSNPQCKRKWFITVLGDTFRYQAVKE